MGPTGSCSPTAWVLKTHFPQEYFHLPEETLQSMLLSVGPEAMQRFLALLHCSWYQLGGGQGGWGGAEGAEPVCGDCEAL